MSLLISLKINDLTSFRLLSVNSQETNIRFFLEIYGTLYKPQLLNDFPLAFLLHVICFHSALSFCSFSIVLSWEEQLNNSLLLRAVGELDQPIGLNGHNNPI